MSGKQSMTDDDNEGRGAQVDALANNAPGAPASALGGDIQAKIGQHLRAMYDDVVRQGVPNRFLDLLEQLDKPPGQPQSGAAKKPGGGADS